MTTSSTGNVQVPTVLDRMEEAIKKGVAKGKINSNQLDKPRRSKQANSIPYQVPGTAAPAATASPLVVQLGSPQQGQAQNLIRKPGDNSNPYYYKPVMPDFSSINPNDPDEIRYQQNIKAQQEAGKNGGKVNAIAYSSKARNDIMDKTAEINRLGQEKMTAAQKADPRSRDIVKYAAVNQLGSPQQGQAQNAAAKPAPKPVPMPQGNLLGKLKGK